MVIAVRVERVTLDTSSNRFVVILKDDTYRRWLPIVVGPAEAQAIALQLEKVTPPRPMTHDLLVNVINGLDAELKRIEVNKLVKTAHGESGTYHARLVLSGNGEEIEVDSRPSDAIAIAVRMNCPIYVADDIFPEEEMGVDPTAVDYEGDLDWDKELEGLEGGEEGAEGDEEGKGENEEENESEEPE